VKTIFQLYQSLFEFPEISSPERHAIDKPVFRFLSWLEKPIACCRSCRSGMWR